MQEQPPDRVGRAARIVAQLIEVGVARFDAILRERRKQVAEGRDRKAVMGDHRCELFEQWLVHALCLLDAGQLGVEVGEPLQPDGSREIAFIRDIVRSARETVDRAYRPAQTGGQQQRRNREVLVVPDAHQNLPWNKCLDSERSSSRETDPSGKSLILLHLCALPEATRHAGPIMRMRAMRTVWRGIRSVSGA